MSNTFLIADLHWSQESACKWLNPDGSKMRPFETAADMDKAMIENWNKTVGQNDKVYVLGDVAQKKSALKIMGLLNGKKVLVKGNHDIYKLTDYTPYFYDIRGSHKLDNFILTHIPIHPQCIARWAAGNIHGHLHSYNVEMPCTDEGYMEDETIIIEEFYVQDHRYFCVSVEQINFAPIAFEEVKKIMKERNEN